MRVLLVEDQAKIASFIVKGLKEQSYVVDHVDTGEEANSLVGLFDYDVILLDIMMPQINPAARNPL